MLLCLYAFFACPQVDTILLDYDENSVIITYDQKINEQRTYKGVEVRQRNRSDVSYNESCIR